MLRSFLEGLYQILRSIVNFGGPAPDARNVDGTFSDIFMNITLLQIVRCRLDTNLVKTQTETFSGSTLEERQGTVRIYALLPTAATRYHRYLPHSKFAWEAYRWGWVRMLDTPVPFYCWNESSRRGIGFSNDGVSTTSSIYWGNGVTIHYTVVS